jgi:nucleotide-binding universal stress UspA family protein
VDPVLALESARGLAQRARRHFEGDVHLHVTPGPFAESLVRIARRVEATQIVIALPEQGTHTWCEQTVREIIVRSPAPLLMVRERLLFHGWASRTRPLVVALDADFSAASRRASRWVEKLAKLGPCELVAVHEYETLSGSLQQAEAARGLAGVATARASVERELRSCLAHLERELQLRTRLVPRRARHEVQLAECAIEEGADLVVLGIDAAKRSDEDGLVSELYTLLLSTDCSLLYVPSL